MMPALDAVLDRLEPEAPEAVARGRLALRRALAWTNDTAWPEVAWSFSELADGLPIELVWRPGEPGLFWTAEPAAPEAPAAAERLARALALAEAAGPTFAATDRRLLAALAEAAPSPWPLWLAGRLSGDRDAAKLYVRLGPDNLGLAAHRLAPLLPALREDDRPVMLGFEPGGGLELYWRRDARRPGDLHRLSQIPGMAPAAERLQRALRDWTGAGLDDATGRRTGLSLKLDAAGRPSAAAAFLRASAVAPPGDLRRRLQDAGGDDRHALADLWSEGCLRPLLLTLGATPHGVRPSLGLTLAKGGARPRP